MQCEAGDLLDSPFPSRLVDRYMKLASNLKLKLSQDRDARPDAEETKKLDEIITQPRRKYTTDEKSHAAARLGSRDTLRLCCLLTLVWGRILYCAFSVSLHLHCVHCCRHALREASGISPQTMSQTEDHSHDLQCGIRPAPQPGPLGSRAPESQMPKAHVTLGAAKSVFFTAQCVPR